MRILLSYVSCGPARNSGLIQLLDRIIGHGATISAPHMVSICIIVSPRTVCIRND